MIERAVVSLITILVYTLIYGWYSYVPSRHTEGTSIGSDRVSWLEQRTVNPRVASSSLATGAPQKPSFYDGDFFISRYLYIINFCN